jgi:hypothetical protein
MAPSAGRQRHASARARAKSSEGRAGVVSACTRACVGAFPSAPHILAIAPASLSMHGARAGRDTCVCTERWGRFFLERMPPLYSRLALFGAVMPPAIPVTTARSWMRTGWSQMWGAATSPTLRRLATLGSSAGTMNAFLPAHHLCFHAMQYNGNSRKYLHSKILRAYKVSQRCYCAGQESRRVHLVRGRASKAGRTRR